MFRIDSADRWQWSEDVFPPLNFCVRALRLDGLRVAPFDAHPGGNNTLRERGLDAAAWRAWVTEVITARAALTAPGLEARESTDPAALAASSDVLRAPSALCPGTTELRERLDEMWSDYRVNAERWKRSMTTGESGVRARLNPAATRWIWQGLLPFHALLATLTVFLVEYPVPVILTVPPSVCVIAPDFSDPDHLGYAKMVVRAAEELAAR